MGQYYSPLLFSADKPISAKSFICSFDPHHFNNGAKLTEHSYFGDILVNAVIAKICSIGKVRLVWVGDYADKVNRMDLYHKFSEKNNVGYYDVPKMPEGIKYLVNHTQKVFVNLDTYPKHAVIDTFKAESQDAHGRGIYSIKKERVDMHHPLPLLTCMGNGRGGGDYWTKYKNSETNDYVGDWAGDAISFETEQPDDYREIKPRFIEYNFDLLDELKRQADWQIKFE